MTDPAQAPGKPAAAPEAPLAPPPMSIWDLLKRHKVAQWTLAYVAAAFTLLHGAEALASKTAQPHLVPHW